MSSRPSSSHVPDAPADEVCRGLDLQDPARALLAPGMTARDYAQTLAKEGLAAEATDVLARWLPPREGVFWACLCIRSASGGEVPPDSKPALLAAERWAADPTEANRRAAEKAAEEASYSTPAAVAALGAFLSGGNLAPEASGAKVKPGPEMTPKAVSGAVRLVAVVREPEKAPERYVEFAGLGLEVAAGRRRPGAA